VSIYKDVSSYDRTLCDCKDYKCMIGQPAHALFSLLQKGLSSFYDILLGKVCHYCPSSSTRDNGMTWYGIEQTGPSTGIGAL
jgi:hypothetical protein